mmetsp:Transcript_34987/g.34006  ORF Transcript_34987/g.34006 Transcript_34987/m.34006 type:complete len:92 (+) Transcript_34987:291-566(+)
MEKPYLDKFAYLRENNEKSNSWSQNRFFEKPNEIFTKENKKEKESLEKNGIRSLYENNGFIEIMNQKNETISLPVDNYFFLDCKSIKMLLD